MVSIFGSEENLWQKTETKTGGQASEMPNDAKHHASVLACKDAQLGDRLYSHNMSLGEGRL